MIALPENAGGRGRFARGVHPPERKELAEGAPIEPLPAPEQVEIPVLQHVGAPCISSVKPKQEVAEGDTIADSESFISAPVHASIAGTVGREGVTTLPNGRHVNTIPVKRGEAPAGDGDPVRRILGGDWNVDPEEHDPGALPGIIREAGIVGHGGAAFPTYVKVKRNGEKPVGTVLVNGCECEPYLAADQRLMEEYPDPVIAGARLAARAAGATRTVIAIEDNKPDAVASLRRAADGTGVEIAVVETRYPMGGEKQTVQAVLGRTIPTGGLPLDVGVVVLNVGTCAAVARAVLRGNPVTHRILSVSGRGIREPKNLLVPIGTPYRAIIEHCGGLKEDTARVVAGGPMMGFALHDLDVPVTKGTSGVLALTEAEIRRQEETRCIRCGRCVDVCPLNLVPSRLGIASRKQRLDIVERYDIKACMECGCCGYICPARIPLVQLIRMGKSELIKQERSES
ncbi:electron transport complex subunit RsxC [Kiritimatiella glycovorans]|uniref:Ion-translocating oxidoreductase complex subunit C n=1 Tax=Kiritimatiella glycovorans TaxID=1307763 RepID=A0A0G3EJV9_9BACT|nr:electron transport complex subunit RsxC [Kiritimatiella glycovorans]AKJ64414.1 Nitrogen fixation protein RnfC [Kiritimatiella glycovorans]